MSPEKMGKPGTEEYLLAFIKAVEKTRILFCAVAFASPTRSGSKTFRVLITVIEFALEPEVSEAAIGNLLEHVHRRRDRGRTYLVWYMTAQTGWILVNRAFDLISRFYKARAGR